MKIRQLIATAIFVLFMSTTHGNPNQQIKYIDTDVEFRPSWELITFFKTSSNCTGQELTTVKNQMPGVNGIGPLATHSIYVTTDEDNYYLIFWVIPQVSDPHIEANEIATATSIREQYQYQVVFPSNKVYDVGKPICYPTTYNADCTEHNCGFKQSVPMWTITNML